MTSAPGTGTVRHASVIVAVGDELLGGFTLDTNSHWLAGQLRAAGYPVQRIETVPDDQAEIVATLRRIMETTGADRIFVCGGLGPTPDDRTLPAVAEAVGQPLAPHPDALAHVRERTARAHAAGWLPSPEPSRASLRMALVPEGSTVLHNSRGTASGIACSLGDDQWLFVLPGPPREQRAILTEELLPRFCALGEAEHTVEMFYRPGVESDFVPAMETLQVDFPDVTVGSYPQGNFVLLLRVHGFDRASVAAAARRLGELSPGTALSAEEVAEQTRTDTETPHQPR